MSHTATDKLVDDLQSEFAATVEAACEDFNLHLENELRDLLRKAVNTAVKEQWEETEYELRAVIKNREDRIRDLEARLRWKMACTVKRDVAGVMGTRAAPEPLSTGLVPSECPFCGCRSVRVDVCPSHPRRTFRCATKINVAGDVEASCNDY